MKRIRHAFFALFVGLAVSTAGAEETPPAASASRLAEGLEEDLRSKTPLVAGALRIARDADEPVDADAFAARLDALAEEARQRLAPLPNSSQRAEAFRRLFFETWTFQARRRGGPERLHPHRVLESREGYCLGLAVLYVALARRAGLDASAVDVPGHLFVRVGEGDKAINVELLDEGEAKSNDWYRTQYDVPPASEAAGVYLIPLDDRALLAHLLNNLAYHAMQARQWKRAEGWLDAALRLRPRFVGALLNRAILLAMNGKLEEARRAFGEVETLHPGHPDVRRFRKRMADAKATDSAGHVAPCR